MAENLSIKKSPIDSVLECPLCLHQLKLPQTLKQCLHSYCKSCLDKVPQKTQDGRQGWLCPMCENFTKCDQVQQDSFIEELQKIHLEPEHCDKNNCEQCSQDCSPATWACTDCKIALCESAKITHLKIPMLKGHKVVLLDSGGEKFIDNIIFCNIHEDIPVQQNCRDCDKLICYNCNITDHNGHIAETIEQALARIIPETESSTKQVDENIDIIQAQIECVNKKIEQTRESSASCRMQMDDHLEKVISRMRAMKAQMEEDVNEQESIALDTLKMLKQQLEKQLSEAKIISNLTAVVTTKTRHTSQLQQLQTGLFAKVKSAGEVKSQNISYNLPETNFVEGQRFQEEIDKVFGKLGFDVKEHIVSISGESFTRHKQFLCSDFNKLADRRYKNDKVIDVNTTLSSRLSYIDNKILLPFDIGKKINIYDEDGELDRVIDTGDRSIYVVKEAHNGDIICAGDSGLFVTDKQFKEWTKLSEGTFHDVLIDKDQFIALQYDTPSVHIYHHGNVVNNGQESSWHKYHSFMLNKVVKVDCLSSICIVGEQCLLISSILTDPTGLFKLTCGGEYLDKCKDIPLHPVICGTDKNNQVLVADILNGAMYLFKPLSENVMQKIAILSDIQIPETRSMVIDRNNNIWILSGIKKPFKLIKFSSQL